MHNLQQRALLNWKIGSLLTVFGAVVLFLASLVFLKNGLEKDEYQKILTYFDQSKNKVNTQVVQERRQTVKSIYFTKEKDVLELRLQAKNSKFIIENNENGSDYCEYLTDVVCYIQTEITMNKEIPTQTFRYVKANHAVYNLSKNSILLEDATIYTYQAEGKTLPEQVAHLTPLIVGEAKLVTCHFEEGAPILQMEKMKVNFQKVL